VKKKLYQRKEMERMVHGGGLVQGTRRKTDGPRRRKKTIQTIAGGCKMIRVGSGEDMKAVDRKEKGWEGGGGDGGKHPLGMVRLYRELKVRKRQEKEKNVKREGSAEKKKQKKRF